MKWELKQSSKRVSVFRKLKISEKVAEITQLYPTAFALRKNKKIAILAPTLILCLTQTLTLAITVTLILIQTQNLTQTLMII